jgi:nucleoside-diphosphate-sugar epimerase
MDPAPISPSHPRQVFLTGANGFVGSHIARACLAAGHSLRALIRPTADRSRLDGLPIEWVVGDLDDQKALHRGADGVDWVIHNAGLVRAPNLAGYLHANTVGTQNLIDAAQEAAPRLSRFVYVSSQAAGGPSVAGRPRTESDAPDPVTPYGKSKLEGERVVMSRASRLPVVSIRPPAVYGPEDTAVLAFFQTVDWHIKPVFGPQPQFLSIVYVEDLVRGILLACEHPGAVGEVFYIAEDRAYELAELCELIRQGVDTWAIRIKFPKPLLMTIAWSCDMIGKTFRFTPRLNRNKARDFLQRDWRISTEKAQRLIGYRSSVPFAEGARLTTQWYRKKGWL